AARHPTDGEYVDVAVAQCGGPGGGTDGGAPVAAGVLGDAGPDADGGDGVAAGARAVVVADDDGVGAVGRQVARGDGGPADAGANGQQRPIGRMEFDPWCQPR